MTRPEENELRRKEWPEGERVGKREARVRRTRRSARQNPAVRFLVDKGATIHIGQWPPQGCRVVQRRANVDVTMTYPMNKQKNTTLLSSSNEWECRDRPVS